VTAGAGDAFAVGAEADAVDVCGVSPERKNLLTCLYIPHLQFWRGRRAGADDAPAVGAEADAEDFLPVVPLESEDRFAGPRLPQMALPAPDGTADAVAAGAEAVSAVSGFVAEGKDFLPRLRVPLLRRSPAGAGDVSAVGAEADAVGVHPFQRQHNSPKA